MSDEPYDHLTRLTDLGRAVEQLGIRDVDELADIARFYYTYAPRFQEATRKLKQALYDLEGFS